MEVHLAHGTVGILFVVQHPVRGQHAALTAAMFDHTSGLRIHEIAHSFQTHVTFDDVLLQAGASGQCQ